MRCRITKEKCKIFLDLSKMPLANGFLKSKHLNNCINNMYLFKISY